MADIRTKILAEAENIESVFKLLPDAGSLSRLSELELAGVAALKERHFGRDKLFIHSKLMRLPTHDSNAVAPYS